MIFQTIATGIKYRNVNLSILQSASLGRIYVSVLTSYSLATETEYVRATTAKYLNDLYSLGVDGWRLDAAKREIFANIPDLH